jgi:hypothetical protein
MMMTMDIYTYKSYARRSREVGAARPREMNKKSRQHSL